MQKLTRQQLANGVIEPLCTGTYRYGDPRKILDREMELLQSLTLNMPTDTPLELGMSPISVKSFQKASASDRREFIATLCQKLGKLGLGQSKKYTGVDIKDVDPEKKETCLSLERLQDVLEDKKAHERLQEWNDMYIDQVLSKAGDEKICPSDRYPVLHYNPLLRQACCVKGRDTPITDWSQLLHPGTIVFIQYKQDYTGVSSMFGRILPTRTRTAQGYVGFLVEKVVPFTEASNRDSFSNNNWSRYLEMVQKDPVKIVNYIVFPQLNMLQFRWGDGHYENTKILYISAVKNP